MLAAAAVPYIVSSERNSFEFVKHLLLLNAVYHHNRCLRCSTVVLAFAVRIAFHLFCFLAFLLQIIHVHLFLTKLKNYRAILIVNLVISH